MSDTTSPKPFVFVLMPFSKEFDDVYKLGIKAACQEAGAYCERVDEQIYIESMLERIYNQISKADIIISDMTGRNPNVFYETGYAHALDKKVIHLTQQAEDIPFDLKHFPHIVYEGSVLKLKEAVLRRVSWLIKNPSTSISQIGFNFEFFINEKKLNERPTINITRLNDQVIEMTYKVHNIGQTIYDLSSFQFGLTAPNKIRKIQLSIFDNYLDGINVETNKLFILPLTGKIFPDAWFSFKQFSHFYTSLKKKEKIEMTLRVFTEIKPVDFPFTIEIN